MKKMKLGAKLNISFAVVLFIPMIIATLFSIVYYSQKIRSEAISKISSDLKIAEMAYQHSTSEIEKIAHSYAQQKTITVLLGLNLGEKLGNDLAQSARRDGIDLITVVDQSNKVLVRAHAPKKIHDVIDPRIYIQRALTGKSDSGTEVLNVEDLKKEGFNIEQKIFGSSKKVLTLTGVAPVYDRQQENVIGVLIARRIINNDSDILKATCKNLNLNTALFESTNLIASCSGDPGNGDFMPPDKKSLQKVLDNSQPLHVADISKGGSIFKCSPITDENHKTIGVLVVQKGVSEYLQTRNIAIITLVAIFLVGFLLALTTKTMIERQILIPVQRLITGTNRISEGSYGYQLEVLSGDEIGELTGAFNKMTLELGEYDRQLKEYNLQLEERVKERTSELQIANEQLISANTVLEDTLEILNPGVSRLIGNNQQQLGLVYATELVADVCNYTKLNMILGETMMGEFMKKFFREGHKLLAEYRGMFDKTVGDQIVAVFGTPKDFAPASPLHPFDAVSCALELVRAAERINQILQAAIQDNYTSIVARHKSLSSEDRKSVRIEDLRFQCRVGINTSNPSSDREIDRMRMVMMGAETCVDYTAQGGAIIYAFRLESTGTPGEIHIGENTKRLVDHVYVLEEMQPITLKGLGIQPRYKVMGHQSLFDRVYPKTEFYQKFCNQVPPILEHLINHIRVGKVEIKEVRKIEKHLDVNISYLEHLSGIYNLSMARALFSYAIGQAIDLEEERLDAMLFAALWSNAQQIKNPALESMEAYSIASQIPDDINAELSIHLADDIMKSKQLNVETQIVRMCNQFDYMVFDRTYLKQRGQEVLPPKEVVSLMKIEGKYEPSILIELSKLFIVDEEDIPFDRKDRFNTIILPRDPEELARNLAKYYSPEQREKIISTIQKV